MYGRTLSPTILESDLKVVLGTDSALTAQVDLIDELDVARRTHQVSDEELFEMVTVRAAGVLRLTEGEGTVREGGVADLIVVEDRGQTPAEAVAQMRPEMVIVRGKARLISTRLLDRSSALSTAGWHSIGLEGRGSWLTDVNLPSLHQETIGALGPEYRLAGKRVLL
jgi:cytosine/adenosine deaminase-related metal-dependent hydrolase